MNAIQRTELHMAETSKDASIGVVIVAFNSSDVIAGCLDSLIAQDGPTPTIVVVDNASDDTTVLAVRSWAKDRKDASGQDLLLEVDAQGLAKPRRGAQVLLLHSGVNLGFAGGVNLGLSALATLAEIAHFWVLNPDAYADPQATIAILAAAQETPVYGLMGGRVCYATPPHTIQTDGGLLNMWTGVTSDVNQGKQAATAAMPKASEIDFINGANMVASRRFYETVGPMREDYFLYYEETDWALRRGDFPLLVASGFIAYHHAGTAIGSPTLMRTASPFSVWFKYRSRMLFIRRFNPIALPVASGFAIAKAGQLVLKGQFPQAQALLRAVLGLRAPMSVRDRLSPEAARIALGKAAR